MSDWDRDCTMRYLNAYPLPRELRWPHRDGGEREVYPVHSAVIGYGKWLRETPYFPGLFELVHDLLERAPEMIPEDYVPAELAALRKKHPEVRERPGEALAHQFRKLLPLPGQGTLFDRL